ncbi:hypothetical protein Indivirus_3_1 [Indivirus ILV1]|uniref:Uncharacterized protein n=1 Tax=Indivirus ILV1 TaxID=1977633 RepID=A0A1V0SDG6_9VIRU|nr:hypothetical protein Indivirus_3_1 [Indivirus ILV1]
MKAFCKTEALHLGKYHLKKIYHQQDPRRNMVYKQKTGDKQWAPPNYPVWTFVINQNYPCPEHPGLNDPSAAYIAEIKEMLFDRRVLMGEEENRSNPPVIDINKV